MEKWNAWYLYSILYTCTFIIPHLIIFVIFVNLNILITLYEQVTYAM